MEDKKLKVYLRFAAPGFEQFLGEFATISEAEFFVSEFLRGWPENSDGSLQGAPSFIVVTDGDWPSGECFYL